MGRGIDKRQKPIWQKIRKSVPPPERVIESKLIKKHYTREKYKSNYEEKEEDVKQKLRSEIMQKRDLLEIKEIEEKSKKIKENLFSLEEVSKAQNIFTYVNFGSEVITKEIINDLLKLKKKILVPIALLKEKKLLISEIRDLEQELEVSTYGILEPKVEYKRVVSPKEVDLVIVPGIIFDKEGFRIGYGGGFYDRLLPELKEGITYVGLAFKFQVIESFPHDINDVPVHVVITEEGIMNIW
ncbi:MAG: 5-formyltetrahydrofolate cyclo-ligase [bacterium]|nr:5-formyltetrahydrofolate cyclo-ligase [bacterium]